MIIHVCGQMGAGKTTLSRALSQRLGWPILSRDATERRLAWALVRRGWDLGDVDWLDVAERLLDEVPWAIYRDHLHRAAGRGRNLIVESTGYNLRERWAWRGVPDEQVLRVWLHAPLDVVRRRIELRAATPEYQRRRPPPLEWTAAQFEDALRAIDRRATEEGAPCLPGRAVLVVDTAETDAARVLVVTLRWLAAQGVADAASWGSGGGEIDPERLAIIDEVVRRDRNILIALRKADEQWDAPSQSPPGQGSPEQGASIKGRRRRRPGPNEK